MPKTTIILIAEDTPEEGFPFTIEERNDQDQVTLFTQFTSQGELDQHLENDYDAKGHLTEQRQYFQGELTQRIEYEYDAAGNLNRETIIFMDDSKSFRTYEREEADNSLVSRLVDEDGEEEENLYRRMDSEGRVVEEKLISEGDLEHHTRSSYDDHGRLLERHIADSEGIETSMVVHYDLDEQGRVTTAKIANERGEVLRIENLSFDERGNRTELQFQDFQQGYAASEQWEYDLNNRVITHTRYSGAGEPTAISHFSYDDTGRLLEEEQRSQQGVRILRYKYE